jgi:hypothetical protein
MSASLLVAVPLALLAIVFLSCFVGCDTVFGLSTLPDPPPPFTTYTPSILAEPTLVAYWSLGEPAGATIAVDLKGGRNGTYLSQVFPDDPSLPSAAAPGVLMLGQPGIVAGDTVPPYDDAAARATCIEVNGGYVSVDFDPALNPTKADGFTIEAWVHVGWSATDPAVTRGIVVAFDQVGGSKGFALFASSNNQWQAFVGNGPGGTIANGPDVLFFDTTNYLVVTYDGSLLRLFVNGSQTTSVTTDYQPSTQSKLFIGAGGTHLPEPRFPWVGTIQCVALYKGALSPEQVGMHNLHGTGHDMP